MGPLPFPYQTGNGGGLNCHFPFFIGQTIYFQCQIFGFGSAPWCSVDADLGANSRRGFCIFDDCRITADGAGYKGTHAVANNGRSCLMWALDPTAPAHGMPEDRTSDAQNYCRSVLPGRLPQMLCITSPPNSFSYVDPCDAGVPICKNLKYTCGSNLVGNLPINSFTANSTQIGLYPFYAKNGFFSAWCAETNDEYQWLQINFTSRHAFKGIGMRVPFAASGFVKTYRIMLSNDSINWNHTKTVDIINGPTQKNKFAVASMFEFGTAIRIIPLTWDTNICLQVDIGGCVCL